jgi:hypothetical protein
VSRPRASLAPRPRPRWVCAICECSFEAGPLVSGKLTCDKPPGMFYHVFDKQDKIREIYFLRQLQHDEAEKKVLAHCVVQCECRGYQGVGDCLFLACWNQMLCRFGICPVWLICQLHC